jgi:adhesin/invasin
MSPIQQLAQRTAWIHKTGKLVAVAASTCAALVSVVTALYSYGVIGRSESHQSIGNLGAAWVGLKPAFDSASAIGDTVHYAATVTDKNGSILVGARPTWTTGDSTVARVLPDGSVIARGPGATTVSVVVGALVAHAKVVVRQRVDTVLIEGARADSGIVLAEGAPMALRARALDARGHAVAGVHAEWQVEDSAVATLDSMGVLTGRNAGRTTITARMEGVRSRSSLMVVTTASAMAVVAGTGQRALAGGTLPQAIVVRATNHVGAPAPRQLVTFRTMDGQGRAEPDSVITDADGRARTTWTLGAFPGRQTLLATVEHVDSALTVVAESDPVASNTRVVVINDHLSAQAGTTIGDSVAVRVTDSTGRALADVPVRWTALSGSAVDSTDARTDSTGVAHARWTLAKTTGVQRLRAEVGSASAHGIPPVTISARAVAGAPVKVDVVSGDEQHAPAGAALSKQLVIRVVDAGGNGVSDVPLALVLSGGAVADSAPHTDSTGVARLRWTMGHAAREYTLTARAEGVEKSLKLSARATPAKAANLSFEDGPTSRTRAKNAHSLYALVTDVYGNPVPEATVSFTTKSGVVKPSRAVTDAKGRAALTWTPGAAAGEQTLRGSVRSTDVTGSYVVEVAGRVAPKTTKSTKSSTTRRKSH